MSRRAPGAWRDRTWRAQHRLAPLLFLLPFAGLFITFVGYPLARSIALSLRKSVGPELSIFVGLANYRFILRDLLFWLAVVNTAGFTLVYLLLQIPLSLGLAILLNSPRLRGRTIFRFAFFAPALVGPVFVAVIFSLLLAQRHGPVNRLIGTILPWVGTELNWTGDPRLAIPALILASLWLSVGYGMIYFLAALQAVDRELYEAARMDGAGPIGEFFHVTLPGIRPILGFLILVGAIAGFQLFELPYILFQGAGAGSRGLTIVMYLFQYGFEIGDIGYASAVGWILVAIGICLGGVVAGGIMTRRRSTKPAGWGSSAPISSPPVRAVVEINPTLDPAMEGTPSVPRGSSPPTSAPPARAGVEINPALHAPCRHRHPLRAFRPSFPSFLALLALFSLLPFFWLLCASFKRSEDFFASAFLPWTHPDRWTLGNYTALFREYPFGGWMINSLFLASLHTVLVVTLSSLGGFALAKYPFRFKRFFIGIMGVTMMIPSQVLLGSSQELMYQLGWIDRYAAIIVPGAVSVFGIFLFTQAMKSVPDELLQAARVDGCSELRVWWEMALPMVRPMIGAYALLSFMGSWNSFLWPQIILQDPAKYTLTIGLSNMVGLPEYQSPYGVLMAGTLLSILPVVVLFFALQRDFIAGLSSGAIKG